MNDFTKEELENILNGNIELYPHSYFHLHAKIQHMIDNYCEHQPSEPILVLNKKCIKCNCHLEMIPWGPEVRSVTIAL